MLPDLFRRLKPVYGTRIDQLWIAYQVADKERRAQIEELLMILAVRKLGIALGDERIVLEPPPADLIGRGEYTIGNVEYPGLAPFPFRLSRNDLLRHVFLLGPSGTGKSTLIIGLLRQLSADRIPWWAVDFKRNYRCMLADPSGQDVVVFTLGRSLAPLALNVLSPPRGVERNAWVEALADIICTAYLLLHGARNVLKGALLGAITNKGERATLRDAFDLVTNELVRSRQGSRRYGWLESTHRSLEELSTGALGYSLNSPNPLSLHELLTVPVVFELEGLGEDQQRFCSLYLLQSILFLRKHENVPREVLRHVLIFDEAHNIFRKDQWGELSLPSKLAREIREYGQSLLSATQQADVADSLIANSGTTLILRCAHPKDSDFASKLLQVDARWVSKIPVGHGIARLATRYYQSFLFTFPEQPLKNALISEERVRERYAQWAASLICTRAQAAPDVLRELERWAQTAKNGDATAVTTVVSAEATAANDPQALGAMAEKEQLLLGDIAAYPISTVTQRYERLGWNPKTGNATKERLFASGLTTFEVLPVLNSRVTLLALTERGVAVLLERGVPVTSSGRAGLEHEFWRQRVRERCESRGYTVTAEVALPNGARVDLCAVKGERAFLIEIETGKSDVRRNVEKCAGQDGTLVVFCTNTTARDEALAIVPTGVLVLAPETLSDLHALLGGFTGPKASGG
jgi:hypothetical protein